MKAIAVTKRGRPKQVANDNVPDRGTQELQLKRALIAQGGDPALVSHPLDLLFARGLIDPAAYRAGWRYAGLYRRVIGRTDVSYNRLYAGLGGGGGAMRATDQAPEDELRRAQQDFRFAQAALRAEGPVVAGITERLVVFGAWPDWLQRPLARTQRELDLLRRGLERLVVAARSMPVNDNGAATTR